MKISYKNYPILEKLGKGSLGVMPMFEKDKPFFDVNCDFFVKNWKFYCDKFQQEINVISEPFYDAANKAQYKLHDLWSDIIKNDLDDFETTGTFIQNKFVYMIHYSTKKGSQDQEIAFYMFDKQGIPLCMFIDSAKYKIYQNGWVSSCFSVENNPTEIQSWIYQNIFKLNIFNMFKNYAEVETKIIPPNSKVKEGNDKYVNDTKIQLTYLDSKWFTNIIKSDEFNVRGHFRLQPIKKDGKWTKNLIWISEFSKTGYTSNAKILTHNNIT